MRAVPPRDRPAPGAAAARFAVFASSASHSATPRMIPMPNSAERIPSRAAITRSRPRMSPTWPTPTPSDSTRKCMGDKIARYRGDADRRQAGRRISPDHQLKGIECAGQRGPERARNRSGGAAADHDALIGAAQMKPAAQRSADPAGKLGISRLEPDRGADAARPDRLQAPQSRCRETTSGRHASALASIGSISRAGRQRSSNRNATPSTSPPRLGTSNARNGSIRTGWKDDRPFRG